MGFFDNAFKNEDMGAAKPAGGAQKKTVEVKVLGKPMQALPGQRLKDVVRASRAPISCGPPRPDRVERPLPSAARAAGSIARTASAARAREKSTGARRACASRRCRRAAARSRRCRAGVYKHIVGVGGCRVARARPEGRALGRICCRFFLRVFLCEPQGPIVAHGAGLATPFAGVGAAWLNVGSAGC